MTVSTVTQTTLVDGVGSVVITDVVQDPVTMQYVRQIRAYSPSVDTADPVLQFTLQLSAPTAALIELVAPAALF